MTTQNIIDIFQKFEAHLLAGRGLSKHTLDNYGRDLKKFFAYISKNCLDYYQLSENDVYEYLYHLSIKKSLSDRTINRHLSSIKAFYQFLLAHRYIDQLPTQAIQSFKTDKKLPKFLTHHDIDAIKSYIEANLDNAKMRKVQAVFYLLYGTGMRISELVQLRMNDISMHNSMLMIKGKGNKERIIPLFDEIQAILDNYIDFIKEKYPKTLWLFPSRDPSKPQSRQAIALALKNVVVAAGLHPDSCSPHILRHSFASHLLQNGMDLKSIQKLLGHENLVTTEIYTHIQHEKLLREVKEKLPIDQIG